MSIKWSIIQPWKGMKHWYKDEHHAQWKKPDRKKPHITLFHLHEMSRIGKSVDTADLGI